MEAKASMKYARTSPRKMRRVIELIRGQHVEEARRILQNLVVERAWVDEGPTLRRYRPRAYGRAARVRKRTAHVTVIVKSTGEGI